MEGDPASNSRQSLWIESINLIKPNKITTLLLCGYTKQNISPALPQRANPPRTQDPFCCRSSTSQHWHPLTERDFKHISVKNTTKKATDSGLSCTEAAFNTLPCLTVLLNSDFTIFFTLLQKNWADTSAETHLLEWGFELCANLSLHPPNKSFHKVFSV